MISTLFTLTLYLLRLPLNLFTLTPPPSQSPHQLCGFSLHTHLTRVHTHILSVATMSHLNTWLPLLLALLILLVFVLLVLLKLLVFVLLALLVFVLLLLLGHMPSPTLHLRHVVLLTKWGNPPLLCLLPYNWWDRHVRYSLLTLLYLQFLYLYLMLNLYV